MINDPDHEEEMISPFDTPFIHLRAVKLMLAPTSPTERVIIIKTPTIEYRVYFDVNECPVLTL